MENVYKAYNFSHFAIYLPKFIKIHENFHDRNSFMTETKMHGFFETRCRMVDIQGGEKSLICLAVLIQYRCVDLTDGQTDGHLATACYILRVMQTCRAIITCTLTDRGGV